MPRSAKLVIVSISLYFALLTIYAVPILLQIVIEYPYGRTGTNVSAQLVDTEEIKRETKSRYNRGVTGRRSEPKPK